MAERPPKPARVHKSIISDQQKRRDIALQRQSQGRRDLQQHARQVVSLFVPHSSSVYEDHNAVSVHQEEEQNAVRIFHNDGVRVYQNEDRNTARVYQDDDHNHTAAAHQNEDLTSVTHENLTDTGHLHDTAQEEEGVAGMLQATRLKGSKAREWFKQQFMLPEWMVDAPLRLRKDWYVMARPAGERCIVVSSNGTTVSRLRNGRILHSFPSALPNGARARGTATSSHVFCILDCIFHKPDSTYYIIDMMCWRGYSLYDCNYEFRHFWIKSKLGETGAFDPPSTYHLYRFSIVPVLECDMAGLQAAYSGTVSFERDGCLFLNRHAHYVLGVTPLALLWKDSVCSRYHIDTDSKGNVPAYQQVVLELKEDGTVATCDDPVCVLGSMPQQFLQQNSQHLRAGMLLRFAIGDHGLSIVNGRPIAADIQYQGLANRFRAGADSVSKVLFQYAARHSPLTISDISKAIEASDDDGDFQMDA